jgi:hypothetical protein
MCSLGLLGKNSSHRIRRCRKLEVLTPFRRSRTEVARNGPLNHSGQESHFSVPSFLCDSAASNEPRVSVASGREINLLRSVSSVIAA